MTGKRLFLSVLLLAALSWLHPSLAQDSQSREEYLAKYSRLVSRLGVDGPGIEPHLNKWASAHPDDPEMLNARFMYYFKKSQSSKITVHKTEKFLGQSPVLELKDSAGAPVYYYEETFYDDELFALSCSLLEQAVSLSPDRIDFRFNQVSALMAYEKESPDMALSRLLALIDYDKLSSPSWKYGREDFSREDFCSAVQEFCYSFHKLGCPGGYDAFFRLARKMNELYPKDVNFIDDLGSFYLTQKQDLKRAEKYFKKALKIDPSDTVAVRNLILLYRQKGDRKSEMKYRDLLGRLSQPAS